MTISATSFFPEGIARFSFVRVFVNIAPQFIDAMSELAFLAIRAVTFLREVLAQGAFYFIIGDVLSFRSHPTRDTHELVIPVSRRFGNSVILGLGIGLQK